MRDTIKTAVTALLDFIDNRAIVRRAVLAFTLYMTYWMSYSAWEFAVTALALKYDGLSITGIIAAIMVPTTALQGFAFKAYSDGRKE